MTAKPKIPKPEALPATYPDIEPGDHVYFRHPEHGPMSARVIATGKHGLTATCPMGDLYRVHWDRVLGVKERMNRTFKMVENGAEGCILEDDKGQRRYVAHAKDDGADDMQLHKSQPTPAQIEAGNYKKQHIRFQGLEISIENPAGSVRKGIDRDGHEWRTKMVHAYGYVRGSKGVDKDHVDCYIGPNPDASHAYIVHQRKAGKWDQYDEDKVMLGFDTEAQAKAAYLKHYDDPRFLGPITTMPMDEFKRKVLATADHPKAIKAFTDHARALFLKARVKAAKRAATRTQELPMLHATLAGTHGPITIKMYGDLEAPCPILIDAKTPSDEMEVRHWLKHGATGLFGHLVGSDTTAEPCDVHNALTNPGDPAIKRWKAKIITANIKPVKADIPDGAVT